MDIECRKESSPCGEEEVSLTDEQDVDGAGHGGGFRSRCRVQLYLACGVIPIPDVPTARLNEHDRLGDGCGNGNGDPALGIGVDNRFHDVNVFVTDTRRLGAEHNPDFIRHCITSAVRRTSDGTWSG